MDFSLREWLTLLGVLVIIVVLLDGYRRVRNNRRNSLKMAIDKNLISGADDQNDYFKGELPNGGARVVDRPHYQEEADHDADELMPDPLFADDDIEPLTAEPEDRAVPATEYADSEADTPVTETETPQQAPVSNEALPDEVIVLNVFAKDEPGFPGDDLMRLVLACDMRFGDMDIFHRYEGETGKGAVQFSMANAMNPGVFDLDNMGQFNTRGVTFFLRLPGPESSMVAFDTMLETAKCVANNLNGELQDDQHSVMTTQTIEHCRQKIRDFERKQLSLIG